MGKSCANLHLASVRLPVWGLYRMFSALFGEGFDLCDEALGCEVASTDVVVLCFFVCFARFWLFDFSAKCDAFMQRGYFFFERVHFVVDKKWRLKKGTEQFRGIVAISLKFLSVKYSILSIYIDYSMRLKQAGLISQVLVTAKLLELVPSSDRYENGINISMILHVSDRILLSSISRCWTKLRVFLGLSWPTYQLNARKSNSFYGHFKRSLRFTKNTRVWTCWSDLVLPYPLFLSKVSLSICGLNVQFNLNIHLEPKWTPRSFGSSLGLVLRGWPLKTRGQLDSFGFQVYIISLWIQAPPGGRYMFFPPNCTLYISFQAADPWIHRVLYT